MPRDEISTMTCTDSDAIAIIGEFKRLKKYPTFSEALEKFITRAEKLNLHRLPDAAYDALVDACREHATTS